MNKKVWYKVQKPNNTPYYLYGNFDEVKEFLRYKNMKQGTFIFGKCLDQNDESYSEEGIDLEEYLN